MCVTKPKVHFIISYLKKMKNVGKLEQQVILGKLVHTYSPTMITPHPSTPKKEVDILTLKSPN